MEYPARRMDELLARLFRFFLGFSDHNLSPANHLPLATSQKPDFTQKNLLHTFVYVYNQRSENNQGESV